MAPRWCLTHSIKYPQPQLTGMSRVDITVPMREELDESIKDQLDYGDSRAEWIRQAIRERLEREGVEMPDDAETDGGQVTLA